MALPVVYIKNYKFIKKYYLQSNPITEKIQLYYESIPEVYSGTNDNKLRYINKLYLLSTTK